jgi:LmbE family N-acetylglucosaminyl deacetylase
MKETEARTSGRAQGLLRVPYCLTPLTLIGARHRSSFPVRHAVLLLALSVLVGCASPAAMPAPAPGARTTIPGLADVLIFAPHPDDESLGCAGIIMQALASDRRAFVVMFTNGDGYPAAAAALSGKPTESLTARDYLQLASIRQSEAMIAIATLGLPLANLIFLGYPDGGLANVYHTEGDIPYQHRFTHKNETYGMARPDYHSQRHGTAAPYRRESGVADVTEILQWLQPSQIYVSTARDTHADHRAASWFVRAAIEAAGYKGQVYTYLIHDDQHHDWPWPRTATPTAPFEAPSLVDGGLPVGLPWPPPARVPLTEEQAQRKLQAIRSYRSQIRVSGDEGSSLESFVKSEEVFWSR